MQKRPKAGHRTIFPSNKTVISLRSALDSSREELRRLKESVGDFSGESYVDVIERLALENHVLRRKILSRNSEFSIDAATSPPPQSHPSPFAVEDNKDLPEETGISMDALRDRVVTDDLPESSRQVIRSGKSDGNNGDKRFSSQTLVVGKACKDQEGSSSGDSKHGMAKDNVETVHQVQTRISEVASDEVTGANEAVSVSIDKQFKDTEEQDPTEVQADRLEVPDKDLEDLSLKSVSDGDNSVFSDNPDTQMTQQHQRENRTLDQPKANDQSENESEELDDIELIFTTDDTCRDLGLQEDLVSITETESWQQTATTGQPVLLKYTKSAEGESLVCNGEKTSSVEEAVSSQSSSIDREESVDRFDESSTTRLNKMWSQCSVLVETDISKCGVVEEPEHPIRHAVRRNTLAAPPTAYRPIIHREALAGSRRKSAAAPLRPVMDRISGARRESGAQTDISALPAHWRSESYLAHKVAHAFTTLPSKFALPTGVPGRLRLSDKTREARRVMLSDISFTSMVPELSRSADHLCHDPHVQTCFNSRGCGLRTPDVHRRESLGSPAGFWPRCNPGTGLPSPCDCRLSTDLYSSRYRGSLSSIPSPGLEVVSGPSRRHSWRATAASFDTWRVPVATSTPRPTWSSMPSSPTHVHPPATSSKMAKNVPKRTRSKVTFQECPMTRGSLPNLRSDLAGGDSGDSTESLIDEAEDYLRRSIDSMLTVSNSGVSSDYWNRQTARRRRARRYSEPDLIRDWHPPQDARPYLPKIPRDIKLDHIVKVISPDGRVLQGRVRYVGPVPGHEEAHVGVELPYMNGSSDGTFHGRRFFDCDPDRAIFVPFKKVILAWCTT
ncbi:uncharacterized protein LOC143360360 isoform X2 [Halictus rubicundus]|uniref:uncharacterized protein LOC143360360 isoform X2 n=1 Tax=Halictus rubicundus TaxID=77578 RepID=UPI0040351DE3